MLNVNEEALKKKGIRRKNKERERGGGKVYEWRRAVIVTFI